MTPTLTIRNITSTPLELKVIERYEKAGTTRIANVTSTFGHITGFVSRSVGNSTSSVPSAPSLGLHAESFNQQDVSIRIEPFQTQTTDIPTTERSSTEVLRLTFESHGQRYRLDATAATKSQSFTPLVADPQHQYTGIFVPEDSHLTIYSPINLTSWMKDLKDSTPLSALSIPGTHNTPTHYKALPSVRCQAVSPKAQLENGIRFFDIRVQPENPADPANDALILVHGVFPISLTGTKHLRALITTTLAFLAANPSETLIMSLKREGTGASTDAQLATILHTHYATSPALWYTAPRIPTLGAARGKIVLVRRFALPPELQALNDGRGWGLNAENWAYNTAHDTHGDVCVQDFCEVLEAVSIDRKIAYTTDHLAAAARTVSPVPGVTTDRENPVPPGPLYLNFLSASNFWRTGCWPERIAARLNPAVTGYLCVKHDVGGEGDGGTGVVVCDWVGEGGDWDLVRCIVGMNRKMEWKEAEGGREGERTKEGEEGGDS
ncbi:PLC-like phosphodiesterase [Mytilinidion resinicola]|uniref:PLC-like phosphodiesterase n=1 Tax=Mytilinidion resinicola TaxID=574789 RepID=A0A6A6YIR5_9PEZI|nr:PLC-like phosphodiesterase [Mytilinidion resinicola]KAF2808438.1 PLC-like phosphodiesterase [Mytilinidion resinicola]